MQTETIHQDAATADRARRFQYGLLAHHELLYPSGRREIDADALELDTEMMLGCVDY